MSDAIVGRWGRNLAIRVPADIVREAGLADGETVSIETREGNILIRRKGLNDRSRTAAVSAAAEIVDDSRGRSLGGVSLKTLIEDGRRG